MEVSTKPANPEIDLDDDESPRQSWEDYQRDRQTAAIHEAGHAVLGLALGLHVECAAICIDSEKGLVNAGTVAYPLDSSLRSKLSNVMCYFAGPFAQRLLLRHSPATVRYGATKDWESITKILDELNLDVATRFMVEHRLRERTKELIWDYEKSIRAVARFLLMFNHIGTRPGSGIDWTRPTAETFLIGVIKRENPNAALTKNFAEC